MLGIVNSLGDDQPKIRFEVARNASSTRVILTDEEQPQIFYTFLAEDTADYDPEFVMAFSYVLGARMAVPLTGDPDLANSLFQQARSVLNSAWASDSNEGIEPSIPDADWIRARA
jgi:hypothetical protein